jgi:hypothetical protein
MIFAVSSAHIIQLLVITILTYSKEDKAISVKAWTRREGSRVLRSPEIKT